MIVGFFNVNFQISKLLNVQHVILLISVFVINLVEARVQTQSACAVNGLFFCASEKDANGI